MPRFVLLYHRCPPGYVRPSHWDLMLECGDMLLTWALAQLPKGWQAAHSRTILEAGDCPTLAGDNLVEATQLADHRRYYLDYEGNLSGERGSVIRVAEGVYHMQSQSPDSINCEVEGVSLVSLLVLCRESDCPDRWLLKCDPSHRNAI